MHEIFIQIWQNTSLLCNYSEIAVKKLEVTIISISSVAARDVFVPWFITVYNMCEDGG